MSSQHPPIAFLRNVSVRHIVRALERDRFQFIERKGSQRVYYCDDGRFVVVHHHRGSDTLPPYVIRNLLNGTQWSESDLRRLRLIR